ncbi:NERD domain-containing protein [Cytobacillus gottheilii]|uniref:NERD domain-containing protein n=1 Tax=Cytobacillus gottheilii TaxID=859144 RepID=A0ABX8FB85_9BACI|nr:NERD domain-containing protein [Cytobacillus gottheilii]QVY60731.1 NERD domain-containing protein [Cytobacillus gottheilii]
MGQLIKLQDYVSRYEQNIYLYPSRYVRLKKQQWEKLQAAWENKDEPSPFFERALLEENWTPEAEEKQILQKLKGLFKNDRKAEELMEVHAAESSGEKQNQDQDQAEQLEFSVTYSSRPHSLELLKQQFLDQIFRFQMKWASSTLMEKSFVDKTFYYNEQLKYFLQRFPDTFLVLFRPIFLLKNAPVETETMVITPTELWCISFLEEEENAVFVGSQEHFWLKRGKNGEKKILNPMLALNRTEKIAKQIFKLHDIELPIKKAIISRNGYIDFPATPIDIEFIESRKYEEWFQSMRGLRSPLKHIQMKASSHLLQYCLTSSIRRLEWEQQDE